MTSDRYDEIKHYAGETTILNLVEPIQILSAEDNDQDFQKITAAIENPELTRLEYAYDFFDPALMHARQGGRLK